MAMKFCSFEVKDEKQINAFLQRVEKYLGSNGTFVFADRVHFMWNEIDESETHVQEIAKKLKENIIEQETQIALQQVEVSSMTEEIEHGTRDIGANAANLAKLTSLLNTMKRKLETTRKVLEKVNAGEFEF